MLFRSQKKKVGNLKLGLTKYEKEISQYEKKVLNPFESKISREEVEVSAYEKKLGDYWVGRKLAIKGIYPFYENKIVLKGYQDAKQGLNWAESMKQYKSSLDKNIPVLKPQQKIEVPRIYFSVPRDLSRTNKIKDFVSKITGFTIKPKTKEFGSPILKFEERAKQTGGYVSVNDPLVVLKPFKQKIDVKIAKDNNKTLEPRKLPAITSQVKSIKNLGTSNIRDLSSSPSILSKKLIRIREKPISISNKIGLINLKSGGNKDIEQIKPLKKRKTIISKKKKLKYEDEFFSIKSLKNNNKINLWRI